MWVNPEIALHYSCSYLIAALSVSLKYLCVIYESVCCAADVLAVLHGGLEPQEFIRSVGDANLMFEVRK